VLLRRFFLFKKEKNISPQKKLSLFEKTFPHKQNKAFPHKQNKAQTEKGVVSGVEIQGLVLANIEACIRLLI
jgi:hypothetical protein